MTIDSIIYETIGKEGAYSNHPADKGGPTKWGITQAVARANGYKGNMSELPRPVAFEIYKREYFIKPGFDKIAQLSEKIAEELFDTGVNMGAVGKDPATVWLQEWLNAFNDSGKLWPDIAEDGAIGPGTLNALRMFLRIRGAKGEGVMIRALNCSQGERYKMLARNREANEAFAFGWVANRVGL